MDPVKAGGPDFNLNGKVAMVTGAGRGLGAEFARALAAYGADVIVADRTLAEAEQTTAAVQAIGRRALPVQANLASVSEIQAMVAKAVGEFGRIDILVNNAGVNITQYAVDVTEAAWDTVLDVNLKAVFFCSQAVGKVMIGQKGGKIINVSSQAGAVAIPQRAAYCASKGGVNQLTRLLALEWARHNINVNAVAPTFLETPLTKPMFQNEEFHRYVLGSIPLGRIGKPSDVTGAVVFLASPAAELVTGHVLHVDGGWTIQ
ncbi:MAG: glucose 1-dehydrogenase [Deltaproteobacteria bacterium]|nr:glucose 1-dehydrogenase [Deltaproteobacteria bacterium]